MCSVTHLDGSTELLPPKGATTIVRKGDRVVVQPAGSGGYGAPHERPREDVLADLANGYISEESARTLYGQDC